MQVPALLQEVREILLLVAGEDGTPATHTSPADALVTSVYLWLCGYRIEITYFSWYTMS